MSHNFGPETESKMLKSVEAIQKELSHIRTGRATPTLLDGIKVESYGTLTPLKQVAAIAVPDPKTVTISPWDKSLMAAIEKAIQTSNLGLNPLRDKNMFRLPIPPLTEERRKELVKQCSKICEEGKVAIRNIRRDENEAIKKAEKDKTLTEDECRKEQENIQKITDKLIKQVDEIFSKKEKGIMSI
jgi:ribosome recycling factor